MKVTPALKKELAQWLDTYWTTYLKGDIETWATFLRDDYRNIGGTKEEIWNSKQEIIDYTYRILDQMIGTAEIRNREIEVIPYGEYMMVNEFTDLYVKIEGEWTFYGPFRMSSLLEKTDTGWIALHQHGSYPDMKAMEGEAFSIDAVKAENARLLAAVKSRTLELEIEAALEKVRAVAMGMKKPEDMLDICRIISDQLQQFGVDKIRNVQLAIIDENIGQYLCYQYFTPYDKTAVEKTEYLKSPVEHGMVNQMLASRDGFFIGGLSGKELEEFRSHRKEENHFPDPFLDKATALDYCFLSIGEGGLGLTLYQPMAEDVLTLFKRFHQVFSLAYQRFRDIQKAEAQAREAQIEVAVERVRAQSMAMHHPDDLDKVNKEILAQLNSLQIHGLSGVTFYLVDQDGWVKAWDFSSPGNIGDQKSYTLQFDFKKYEMMGYPFKIFQQTDLNYLVADYPLEKLERAVYEIEEINPEVATVVKEALAKGILTHQWSACARISDGILGIDLVSPPSEDTKTIVLKIAGAFNQAYQRFLDLQKAEAQAREAQIEASLERTRTQSMLMQHSDEIKSISNIFHEQLLLLDIPSEFSYVWLPDEASQSHQFWASWSEKNEGGTTLQSKQVTYPLDKTEPYTAACYTAWAHPDVILEEFIPSSDIAGFFEVWQELLAGATKLKADFFPKGIYYSEAYMRYGCFGINIRRKLSEEEKNILKRFSIEFERAYTRFLDLKKAELQAREAQIEAALERVRAQTMAMHSSEDVGKCVVKMFSELTALGVDEGTRFGIGILNHDNENNQLWTACKNGEEVNMHIGNIDMASHPLLKSARKAWKAQVPFHRYVLKGKDLLNYYQMLNNAPDYKIQIPIEKLPKKEIQHCFIFEHGFFYAFSPREFQPDLIHITKRFSSLFEQTYRRYLDLVRAEGQAREAEIELALERVRARTMAMHQTEELKDVIQVVFDQFVGLNIHLDHAGFILDYKEREDMHIWLASHQQGVPTEITFPYFNSPNLNSFRQAKAKQESFFANLLPFEVKNKFYQDLFELIPELTEEAQQAIFSKPALAISTVLLDNVGLYIQHYSETPFTAEENAILMRFGKVFQQTYTRFLDLQKAEAQAREAKIEGALERIRSRSLAMHTSDELEDVIMVVSEQLQQLQFRFHNVSFSSNNEQSDITFWLATPGKTKPLLIKAPYLDTPALTRIIDARKNGVDFLADVLSTEENQEWLQHTVYNSQSNLTEDDKKFLLTRKGMARSTALTKNITLMLVNYAVVLFTDEQNFILKRFGNVFDQSYTRFLDLQKAEAQAREAQIEAALEKVRSHSLAMQSAGELQDVVTIVGEKLKELGVVLDSGGVVICTYFPDSKDVLHWTATFDSSHPSVPYYLPYFDTPIWKETWHSKFETVDDFFEKVYSFEDKNHFFHYAFKHSDYKNLPDEYKKALLESETHALSFAWQTNSALMIASHNGMLLPEEHKIILKRFAKVFEQAFIRFMDLQKAEKQTRESQIELSLERVRAKAMAMHQSGELSEVLSVLFDQFDILGINPVFAHLSLIDLENNTFTYRMTGRGGKRVLTQQVVDLNARDEWKDSVKAFKKGKPNTVSCLHFPKEALPQIWELFNETLGALPKGAKIYQKDFPDGIYNIQGYCKYGYIGFNHNRPATEEEKDIVVRFATEFGRMYQRFLDIQKAEAQAREAQIEAALEKVRSRSLAMQSSKELQDVVQVIAEKLTELGVVLEVGGVAICTYFENSRDVIHWTASSNPLMPSKPYFIEDYDTPMNNETWEAKLRGDDFFEKVFSAEENRHYFENALINSNYKNLPEEYKEILINARQHALTLALQKNSALMVPSLEGKLLNTENKEILIRFSKVFEQVYIRFMDLERAEKQAREAQIEAALERVRSRSMAMHQTDELNDVLCVLLEQFDFLGINPVLTHLTLFDEANGKFSLRLTTSPTSRILVEQIIDIYAVESWKASYENWKKGVPNTVDCIDYPPEVLPAVWEVLSEVMNALPEGHKINPVDFPNGLFTTQGHFKFGYLGFNHSRKATAEEKTLVSRFATEFGRAYQRFLDIQKAEAQAREAQIEAALERVRSRSMAMHKSEELLDAGEIIFVEMQKLGIESLTAGLVLMDKEEKNGLNYVPDPSTKKMFPVPVIIPHTETRPMQQVVENWKKGSSFFIVEMDEDETIQHQTFIAERSTNFPLSAAQLIAISPARLFLHNFYFKEGYVLIVGGTKLSGEQTEIMLRFAKVFQQTYTRFLDLQKAEAQARESQIQLALERVRARTMAMQHSDELMETSELMFEQIKNLGIELWSCGFSLWYDDDSYFLGYNPGPHGKLGNPLKIPLTEDIFFTTIREAKRRGDEFVVFESEGESLVETYRYMDSLPVVGETMRGFVEAGFPLPTFQVTHCGFFSNGHLMFITQEPNSEAVDIFKRFTKVFIQTYTRFLDLQKAEAQAREAQIEAALERVRSRTMAMRKSEELADVATIVFQQVKALGVPQWTCGFNIWEPGDKEFTFYPGSPDGEILAPCKISLTEHPVFMQFDESRKRGDELYVYEKTGEIQADHYRYMHGLPGVGDLLQGMLDAGFTFPDFQIDHLANFSYGNLIFVTYEPVPEMHDVFKRFAKVFEQTYTRFLDLQKAEAQARESQIQLAMERVRARTMAMQHSNELTSTASLLFQQIQTLGVPPWSCGFNIWEQGDSVFTSYMGGGSENFILEGYKIPLTEEATFIHFQESRDRGDKLFVDVLEGETLESHYRYFFTLPGIKEVFEKAAQDGLPLPTFQINHLANFSHGNLMFITYEPCPEAHDIFIRFAKVFEQTYTRFLDLQKAEAQAREAQIEAALEKVRSRSLAMQHPDELTAVVQLLREEMGALGVEELETSSIYIHDEYSNSTQCWFTIKDVDNPEKAVTDQMTIDLQDTWVGRKMHDFYRSPTNQASILMQGEQRIEWIRYCEKKSELFGTSNFYGETIPDRTYHLYKFSNGFMGAAAPGEISRESWELLKRATAVFSFAYMRFRDLQMAEASAHAARRQASLDRVRADISSMRSAEDLDRITPLIFNELTTLGIPFIRCGVFIVNEEKKSVEVYLSTPDGKSLAAMNLPFSANEITIRSVDAWRRGEVYRQHWDKTDFLNWGKSLLKEGHIKNLDTYQGAEAPPESLDLHFIPFAQGLLYIGATERLNDEQTDLVEALAQAFSVAYARYDDFRQLEAANIKLGNTLDKLKSTQNQLIHAEKMASLGELTAGIAHEIQNPLNFVNNFSEVNIELMEELKAESSKLKGERDETLEEELWQDLQENEKKINHHGKRADAIVKSMLQHSRAGSGQKEPTDINALADEYLRLSYHGLRAKDKAFNADFMTELEPALPRIKVIPQDVGRVLLNLINNAFHAVSEKAKKGIPDYKPLVTVKTKKHDNLVEIRVKDNGDGIPDDIVNKIFQPFFTTKPTGEGTGLGLSLSYDIVTKGHNGTLEVDTAAGLGSVFVVQLPIV